jgi:glycine oxidase
MKDFIIVGQGLAAHVLMHTFHRQGISFMTVGNDSLSSCSRVAAGIWNPVVFKRMTKSWLADALIPSLEVFYTDCELRLHQKLITRRPIIKPFTEEQEKRLWTRKAGLELRGYLDDEIHVQAVPGLEHCNIPNGYGIVKQSGSLDVAGFIDASTLYFKDQILHETLDYEQLRVFPDKVSYRLQQARHIIFCEGHLVSRNPFFNWIPLKPAKGEVLTVSIPELGLKNTIFNKNGFLMDTPQGVYKTGATYEWQNLTEQVSQKGLKELVSKLEQMTGCAYAIQKQEAGIRPSSLDRRPLIGRHPVHAHLFVFNGLGTKGVMLAPFFANNFVNFYLQKEAMHPEADLSRFYSLYDSHPA